MTAKPTAETESDEETLESLMRSYQEGDGQAASTLVGRLSPQIFRFFLAQVRERSQAEDLLQDLWLRVHNSRRTYRSGEPLLPWVYAIARRVQVDAYRRRSRIFRHELQSEMLPDSAARDSSPAAASLDIDDLLKKLPERQRETILLLKVAGLTLNEVARATGSSVGSVKQRAHRAYETLRKAFGDLT